MIGVREQLTDAIKNALADMGAEHVNFTVERPGQMEHGDYATNAALVASKVLERNPRDVAQDLAAALGKQKVDGVESVAVAGAGFINFHLSRAAVAQTVAEAVKEGWGKNTLYAGKNVMVEYTDPNPFKEFHIGHLMSNAIGESIARLFETAGADVKRANYQGDVGLHVAKAIHGMQISKNRPDGSVSLKEKIFWLGGAYVAGSAGYDSNPEIKSQIDQLNKIIYEKSNPEINALYDWGRKVSLEHFEELYKELGTKFDFYFFESDTWEKGLELVQKHTDVFIESEGARIFRGEEHGLHTRVFINSQGVPTYEAKDLGLLALKKEKGTFDESITITASEQKEYFKVVLEAARHIPELADIAQKTMHIAHGMMRFASGKMSSRKGNVITGESLLDDLKEDTRAKMGERQLQNPDLVAEQVAVGAIKYAVLRQGSGKDIVFDPEKSLSLEGDSGPYLQYAHTRAVSLLKKAEAEGLQAATEDMPAQTSVLERTLLHYPDVVERAARELEPHYVVTYLAELASAFNSWYASERVIGGSYPHYGVLLAQAVERTLKGGLSVLGIPAPEEM